MPENKEIFEKVEKIIKESPLKEFCLKIDGISQKEEILYITLETPNLNISNHAFIRSYVVGALASYAFSKIMVIFTAHKKESKKINRVNHCVAIASGKGGVGKSTVALFLSKALARLGKKVGLLDGDIYGPSLPTLFRCHDKPGVTEEKKLIPLYHHGLSWISIGLMVPEETAMIWRGPMVQSALKQLLKEVDWGYHEEGGLDFLIVDMPPGTGDIPLTLVQQVSLSGVVIVSTPQNIALADAKRALSMFQKVNTPILGMVENMAYVECAQCHHSMDIFGHDLVKIAANQLSVPFLGKIPIMKSLQSFNPEENFPFFEEIAKKIESLLALETRE